MKKFVTTLLALLLTVALAVGFTACKEKEVYDRVTEKEWRSALNLFCGDPSRITEDDLNLAINTKMNYTVEGTSISLELEWKLDYVGKAASSIGYDGDLYIWQDEDGKWYRASCNNGSESDNFKHEITGNISTIKLFSDFIRTDELDCYTFLNEFNVYYSYGDFIFDEKRTCYVWQDVDNIFDESYRIDLALFFSNGKLAKTEAVLTENYEGDKFVQTMITTFTYGSTTVTIPDEVKNYQG